MAFKTLLTTKQVQQSLGISRSMLCNLVRSGEIPVTKIGRTNRFDPDLIEEYLRRQTKRHD